MIEGLEHRLHPWSSFVVVPLFALANAGIVIDSDSVEPGRVRARSRSASCSGS